ncbi:hypothetical protein M405DRAFT_817134 [Rhizopogon salebrosus TDB-379]|nr:hypothetical protein M405DRAFT_817134 [Rhizopogon salebrosus TDB-379]
MFARPSQATTLLYVLLVGTVFAAASPNPEGTEVLRSNENPSPQSQTRSNESPRPLTRQ